MSATRDPRPTSAASNYYYRRTLGGWELLPAIGIAIGAGITAFYFARLLLERTPVALEKRPRRSAARKRTNVRDVRAG